MLLAAARDAIVAAPLAFVSGLIVGLWLGARFLIIRKRGDVADGE